MKKPLWIAVGVLVVLGFFFGGTYNKLVSGEEGVKTAWSQVENVYQRRVDLVPNLVETVKGYAAHEKETLQNVIEARAKVSQITLSKDVVNNPQLLAQFQQSQGALAGALSRIFALAEQYPNLKANENFLALQTQLEGTENRIAVERMRYNEAAKGFNTLRRTFPTNIFANWFNFGEKAYFEADAGAEKAPEVKF